MSNERLRCSASLHQHRANPLHPLNVPEVGEPMGRGRSRLQQLLTRALLEHQAKVQTLL